jgi:hypothetical protein
MSTGADSFASATEVVITSGGGTYTSDATDNGSLSMETGEPQPTTYTSAKTAWWKYTPSSSGTASFNTTGTTTGPGGSTDTEMAVYTGSVLTSLTKVGANSDSGVGNTSVISGLSVTAGTTYYVQVGGTGGLVSGGASGLESTDGYGTGAGVFHVTVL